jgi:hypothetical protein
MPREAPAIVKRPKGAYFMLFNVIKQHGEIYVAIMQGMKMYNIRGEISYGLKQLFGRSISKATVISRNSRKHYAHTSRSIVSYFNIRVFWLSILVGNRHGRDAKGFNTHLLRLFGDTEHYISRTAENASIDLQKLHKLIILTEIMMSLLYHELSCRINYEFWHKSCAPGSHAQFKFIPVGMDRSATVINIVLFKIVVCLIEYLTLAHYIKDNKLMVIADRTTCAKLHGNLPKPYLVNPRI